MPLTIQKAREDWSSREKLDLQRLHTAYPPPDYEIECSLTEEGDPWCVVRDCVRDTIIVHIARIGNRYVVAHPERNIRRRVAQMRTAVDLVVQ